MKVSMANYWKTLRDEDRERRVKEKDAQRQYLEKHGATRLTLRKVVSHELPVIFAMAVLYAIGKLTSLSAILIVLVVAILIDFIITYTYLKQTKL